MSGVGKVKTTKISFLKQPECGRGGKQNDLFQHHAGRKPYTIKTASLLIANFRGTLACILLSYYLLKVQEDLGGGEHKNHPFLFLWCPCVF